MNAAEKVAPTRSANKHSRSSNALILN
jgi:hypothetical protein